MHGQHNIKKTVGLLSASDQLVKEANSYTTNTRDKRPCTKRDSNPPSQQSAVADPTPYTARPPGSASIDIATRFLHALAPSNVFINDRRLVGVTNDPAGNILTWIIVRLEKLSHRPPGFDSGQLCQIFRSPLRSSLPYFLFLL